MHRGFVLPWIVGLPLLLGGCTSPFHRIAGAPCTVAAPVGASADWEPANGPCRDSWAVRATSHGVNYVEIDEQGILHDRAAAEDALAFAAAPPSDGARIAYVVVFIHGWHHDAAAGDTNVQAFHRALASVKRWRPQADVRGIYIGWRGSSLPLPLLRYLTFWERKNTSDEIGRGSLLEFLLGLERSVKPVPTSSNRLVLIGHSSGASVAFNALAHVHMQRFVDGLYATAPGERFRGYGDLTVLINPAIEAMRYMPLQSAVEYYAAREQTPKLDFTHEKKPRLIILSSDGDLATHCTFLPGSSQPGSKPTTGSRHARARTRTAAMSNGTWTATRWATSRTSERIGRCGWSPARASRGRRPNSGNARVKSSPARTVRRCSRPCSTNAARQAQRSCRNCCARNPATRMCRRRQKHGGKLPPGQRSAAATSRIRTSASFASRRLCATRRTSWPASASKSLRVTPASAAQT